jgi:hypothetical protein
MTSSVKERTLRRLAMRLLIVVVVVSHWITIT